jgi:hypothetical protein
VVGDLRVAWGRSVAVLDVLERVRATGTAPELPSDVVLSLKLRLDSVLVCMMVHAVGQRRGMLRLHGDLVEVVAVLHLGQMHLLRLSCMVHVPRRWSDGRLLHVLARRCKSMMMEAVRLATGAGEQAAMVGWSMEGAIPCVPGLICIVGTGAEYHGCVGMVGWKA